MAKIDEYELQIEDITRFVKEREIDLRSINLLNHEAIDQLSPSNNLQLGSVATQSVDIRQLRAAQRILRLLPSESTTKIEQQLTPLKNVKDFTGYDVVVRLINKGMDSAYAIASMPEDEFVKQYADCFFDTDQRINKNEQARKVYRNALAVKSKAVLDYFALTQHKDSNYQKLRFDNLSDKTDSNYSHLPSYEELFGGLNFCSCKDCRSIFSPAAYLVDLMRVASDQIEAEAGKKPDLLNIRRPDLQQLELSCNNTNNLVSKLEIVNKVLLNQIPNGDTAEAKYKALATTTYPFNLPFNLPLTEIRTYLDAHKSSLAKIWQKLAVNQDENIKKQIYLDQLGITLEQWSIYSTIQTDETTVAKLYNVSAIPKLSYVEEFIDSTGLDYAQLNDLLYQDLSEDEVNQQTHSRFFINSSTNTQGAIEIVEEKDSQGNPIKKLMQFDRKQEKKIECTVAHFDALHRFIRLVRILSWSFTELDLALLSINSSLNKNTPVIDDTILPHLTWIKTMKDSGILSINEACGFLSLVKNYGQKNGSTFFDSIFNASYVPTHLKWPDDQIKWIVPQADDTAEVELGDKQIQSVLAAALKLNNNDLLTVARAIQVADQGKYKVQLSLRNLSLLYRLSLLPKITRLSINECSLLYSLMLFSASTKVSGTQLLKDLVKSDDGGYRIITQLTQTSQEIQATGLSIYQLQYWLTGDSDDKAIKNQILGQNALINAVKGISDAVTPLLFDKAKFIHDTQSLFGEININGLSDEVWNNIEKYYIENGIVKKIPQSIDDLVLKIFPIGLINLAIGKIATLIYANIILQQQTFYNQLAGVYGIDPKLIAILAEWARLNINDIIGKELDSKEVRDREVLVKLQILQCYVSCIKALQFSFEEVQTVYQYPQYFDIIISDQDERKPLLTLTLKNIQTLYKFKYLLQHLQDDQNRLLAYFPYANDIDITNKDKNFTNLDLVATRLSGIMGWDKEQLKWLMKKLWVMPTANTITDGEPKPWAKFLNILLLQDYFAVATATHLDVNSIYEVLQILLATGNTYEQLQNLANNIWAGLQVKCTNEPNVLSNTVNIVNNKKRDALLPLVINTLKDKNITNARDLYEYLLIDVEADAVVETSYVVEAISAVQLYIYRCLNNLEQGISIKEDLHNWWVWMENYRIWQANREVFLYPENYIEPELRKDKTSLFTKLASDLQQADLKNNDSIQDVINNYIDGLAKIADLEIVGSGVYDHVDNQAPANNYKNLILIGASKETNPVYYYLTGIFNRSMNSDKYTAVSWSEWKTISVNVQPTGNINPVFAFEKWYIFWVEQQQSGRDETASSQKSTYTATVCYSFLNNSGNWSTKQSDLDNNIRAICDLKTANIWEIKQKGTDVTNVYPIYINSIRTLYLSYPTSVTCDSTKCIKNKESLLSITGASLYNNLGQVTKYITKNSLPNTLNGIDPFSYNLTFDKANYKPSTDSCTISFWFYLNNLNNDISLISQGNTLDVKVTKDGLLKVNNNIISTNKIVSQSWNHLSLPIGLMYRPLYAYNITNYSNMIGSADAKQWWMCCYTNYDTTSTMRLIEGKAEKGGVRTEDVKDYIQLDGYNKQITGTSLILYKDIIYICWSEKDGDTYIGAAVMSQGQIIKAQKLAVKSLINTAPKLAVFQGKLYITWLGADSKINLAWIDTDNNFTLKEQVTFQDQSMISNITPEVIKFNNALYFVFVAKNSSCISLARSFDGKNLSYLDDGKNYVRQFSEKSIGNISLVVEDRKLWLTWRENNKINLGWIADSNIIRNEITDRLSYEVTIDKDTILNDPVIGLNTGNLILSLKKAIDKNSLLQILNPNTYNLYLNNIVYPFVNKTDKDLKTSITVGSKDFPGVIQEALLVNELLSRNDIQKLYDNSRERITVDFINFVDVTDTAQGAFGVEVNAKEIMIPAQPNWNIIKYNNTSFLTVPYSSSTGNSLLECMRLNSTGIHDISAALRLRGLDGLLTINSQKTKEIAFAKLLPNRKYIPQDTDPSDTLDFTVGPISNYYWELFFYMPFTVARQLQIAMQFTASKQWYEYIFNPTIKKSEEQIEEGEYENDKYWRFLGLRSLYNPTLNDEHGRQWSEEVREDTKKDSKQLYQYHNDPFDPHAIARLRPIAYQKTLLMHYIDNLLDWADNLYRKHTTETINEAVMLYITAYDLLGKKPLNLGECKMPADSDLKTILDKQKDKDSNEFIIIMLEQSQKSLPGNYAKDSPVNYIANSYFGLPANEQFNGYWDKVIGRLYNIRHSLTIDGIFEQVALFAPHLDLMQLVKQIGSGSSLNQVLEDITTSIPYYRYRVCIDKAKEITNFVIQLGNSLLGALEKKDAESLSRLYSTNQQNILALTRVSNQNQLKIAQTTLDSLQASLANAQHRLNHYNNLINVGLSVKELKQIELDNLAVALQTESQLVKTATAVAYLLPNIFGLADGGMNFGSAAAQISSIAEGSAFAASMASGLAGTIASYQRRAEDWQLQKNMADDDIKQISAQILGAQYQQIVTQQEMVVLEKNIEQEQKVEQFLINKFTNQELYQWIVGKLSVLYFQSYQLAFKLAKQAEQAFYFEKGIADDSKTLMIQSGYWNSLYNGLLAGEALMLDLHRMEQSYMQQDNRKLEIQKTISLAQVNPAALLDLKNKGNCIFELTEKEFDYDYPGHYCRQIKTISLSLPALLGPYQNIHATLIQTSNKTLIKPDIEGVRYLLTHDYSQPASASIKADLMSNQQVALSQGVNDNGLFTLNFGDERYLPFEGTGVISTWQLDMPHENNLIDFTSLADVIIQLSYTANTGDNRFREDVNNEIKKGGFNGYITSSLAQDYASNWNRFITDDQQLVFNLKRSWLNKRFGKYKLNGLYLQLILTEQGQQIVSDTDVTLNLKRGALKNESGKDWKLVQDNNQAIYIKLDNTELDVEKPWMDQNWNLSIKQDQKSFIKAENIKNIILIASYEAS